MTAFWWIFGIILFLAAVMLAVAFWAYGFVFKIERRPIAKEGEYDLPVGDIYDVYREDMIKWVDMARHLPHENVEITSRDGLKLRGKYYEYKKGAPMEILIHGYKGNSERDLSGGIERCFKLGRNAMLVDQRAAGRSEGDISSFGILEMYDCIDWINFAVSRFGSEVKIGITGVSMGAATVMMAAGQELPENVKFVLADCGFSSPEEIIKKVGRELGLPKGIAYFFARLGGRVFGGFDIGSYSPMQAMKTIKTPIIFVHGDTDAFVPFSMSERLYNECTCEKKRIIAIKGAGHGLAYPVGRDEYIEELRKFDSDFGIGCVGDTKQ